MFYKLTRMMLSGQVEPADSLTFHRVVFLSLNGHTIINQVSGVERHARARVQDLSFGETPPQLCYCINSYRLLSQNTFLHQKEKSK